MKQISESVVCEKINVSTEELEATETQIIGLQFATVDKIDLIIANGEQRLVEVTGINLDITRYIKIIIDKNGMAINLPIDEPDDCDDNHGNFDGNNNLEDRK